MLRGLRICRGFDFNPRTYPLEVPLSEPFFYEVHYSNELTTARQQCCQAWTTSINAVNILEEDRIFRSGFHSVVHAVQDRTWNSSQKTEGASANEGGKNRLRNAHEFCHCPRPTFFFLSLADVIKQWRQRSAEPVSSAVRLPAD